jgi:putative membrane protein
MLIEIIIFLFLGIFLGLICGLLPGIHINLIGTILITLSATTLAFIEPLYFVVLIVSMAITQTFFDFIPGILLGCPDEDSQLSVLPGHQLLKKGQAYQAIRLTSYGCLIGIILLFIIILPTIIFLPTIYNSIKTSIPFILIFISLIMILSEKTKSKAFLVFIFTGILGYLVLNNPSIKEPLMPLLTGLFGSSTLIMSMRDKVKIPLQEIKEPKIKNRIIKPAIGSLLASPLCAFIPGVGGGQAAVIANIIAKTKRKGFLVLLGATNMLVMCLSFIAIYSISKGRTGAAAAIQTISGETSIKFLILMILIIIFSGIISFLLVKSITKNLVKIINKVNYFKLSIITLLVVSMITLAISGILGILVLIISTLTGIYCIQLKTKRTCMMACLMVPVILFYLL